jgi:plastocyanin
MNKILALLGVALILVTGAAAIGLIDGGSSSRSSSSSPAAPAAKAPAAAVTHASVPIADFKFMPAAVHVKVGGRVTWANRDTSAHTATADQGPTFDTGTLKQGKRKTLTFATAGTFTYHCAFHAFMKGTVTVG